MRLTEFLINEAKADPKELAKKSAARAQAVWATKDIEAKKSAAKAFINGMAFKDKIATNLRKLEAMQDNANKIDKFIGDIQLKGEGQGVV